MGASAGGLEAFREFFRHVPRDVGAAFVLVQHFPPQHDSNLHDILRHHTPLPVSVAEDGRPVCPNHVFVAPVHGDLGLEGGRFRVRPRPARAARGPIDAFLVSLAEDQGELAVAVMLSGLDGDGAQGLRAVEEHGGIGLVQAPQSAAFDVMPRRALAQGQDARALTLPDLARTLVRHVAAVAAVCQGPYTMSRGVGEVPPEILAVLRDATGRDLSGYKAGTLARRIARRMQVLEIDALSAYLDRLRADAREPAALLRELLIGVTSFFRDEDVFRAVEERVLPRLAREAAGRELRIWVPGCSTGEEAYTLAMLAKEAVERAPPAAGVQVFATDLDAHALEVARAGHYGASACERVSRERLARWFAPEDGGFAVTTELRECCLFSLHHVTGDPPFSRLDLVSCRNLLIYLENELKRQVLPVFHHGLRPGGVLVLGPSEGIGEHDDLFQAIDAKLRLYERRATAARPPPRFRFSVRGTPRAAPTPAAHPAASAAEPPTKGGVESLLLRELSPAAALVDARGHVLHLSGPVSRWLEPPQGPPTSNVVELVREPLRLEVRSVLHKAVKERREVVRERLAVVLDGRRVVLDVLARPVGDAGEPRFLVVFREREAGPVEAPPEDEGRGGPPAEAERLRAELRATKEHLQTTIEELEASNTQLKVSNEELTTLNEELQSANEELQTSQEELQSLNEELETLNADLSAKVEQLDRAHADLQNLFQSTQLAALFLGRDLTIKKFTPAATQLFRLIDGDVGRPITDLASRVDADIVAEVSQVLLTLAPRERSVRLEGSGAWYVLRALPYVTRAGAVDGVVVTFTDVTASKRAEEAVRESERRQREILDAIPPLVWTCQPDGACDWLSGQWLAYTGAAEREVLGFGWLQQVHPDDRDRVAAAWRAAGASAAPFEDQLRLRRADGAYRWFQTRATPLRDADGRVVRWFGSSSDVDDLMRAQAALGESERRFRAAIESFPGVFVLYDEQRRFRYVNAVAAEMGRPLAPAEVIGRRDEEVFPDSVTAGYLPRLREAFETGRTVSFELELPAPFSGTMIVSYVPLHGEDGAVRGAIGFTVDITEHKRMEERLKQADRRKDEFLALLGHELRNPLAPLQNGIQLMRRRAGDPAGAARALEMMDRQVRQLRRLVDDLLDVERITRGKVRFRPAPVDLAELVRATVDDHRSAFDQAGVALALRLPAGPLAMQGDAARLAQALGNLLQNAVKFTARGGRVEVTLAREGDRAELAVRDTGVGIDPAFLPRLFEPFAQEDGSLAREGGGLGLGLALVRGVAEMHGGAARAESGGRGQGSAFVLALPLGPPGPTETPAPVGTRTPGRLRILVVDDNADAGESLGELLELEGHAVRIARDGPAGVEAARAFRPHVVLCDIGLPGALDGYGVARALRADPALRGAYLVALTGYAGAEHRRRAAEAGFDRHLAKPPSLEAIAEIVAAATAPR
jgi:two-component system CheB/CheR fusion protein